MASKSKIGDVNRNNQRLVEKTNHPGNDHNQCIWILECQVSHDGLTCGHVYGANGPITFSVSVQFARAGSQD